MDEQEAAPASAEPAAAVAGGHFAGQAELDASFAKAFLEHDTGQPGDDDEAAPQGETEGEAGGPARGEDGKFAAREDDEPEAASGKTATETVAADDESYEKALLALRYSGVPSAIIKNASRDELIAWGTEAADRRAKTEAALEERATRIRELEDGAKKAPATEPAAKPADVDWSPHLTALAETLGLDSKQLADAFKPALDAVAQQVRSEFEGRLAPMEQRTQESQAAEGRRQISEQVRRLADAHPKLKTDGDLVQKLNGKALALWKSGEYRDAESVYDDAAKLVLGAPTASLAAKRRNGAAAPPEGRMHDAATTGDEAFLTAMERSEAGDARGARRAGSAYWDLELARRTPKK